MLMADPIRGYETLREALTGCFTMDMWRATR
jgi:hypothetical protein